MNGITVSGNPVANSGFAGVNVGGIGYTNLNYMFSWGN